MKPLRKFPTHWIWFPCKSNTSRLYKLSSPLMLRSRFLPSISTRRFDKLSSPPIFSILLSYRFSTRRWVRWARESILAIKLCWSERSKIFSRPLVLGMQGSPHLKKKQKSCCEKKCFCFVQEPKTNGKTANSESSSKKEFWTNELTWDQLESLC